MPSNALKIWRTTRSRELDEIEQAHQSVGGTARGRRFATGQVNNAYLMLLSGQFQSFCRDLHSECIDDFVEKIEPAAIHHILRSAWITERSLDKYNPTQQTLVHDFNRLGIDLDSLFKGARNDRLIRLNAWRNAISHQDFNKTALGGKTKLRLDEVRGFRKLCNRLATMLDKSARRHIKAITGEQPWQ